MIWRKQGLTTGDWRNSLRGYGGNRLLVICRKLSVTMEETDFYGDMEETDLLTGDIEETDLLVIWRNRLTGDMEEQTYW